MAAASGLAQEFWIVLPQKKQAIVRARSIQVCTIRYIINLLFGKVLEAKSQFVLMFGGRFLAIKKVFQENIGDLHGSLIDRRPNAALQDHLQNFRIGRMLSYGRVQFGNLLLDVLDGHLDRR